MRKKLIVIFTFLGGAYYFFEFVLPKSISLSSHPRSWFHDMQLGRYNDQISTGINIVGTMAIFLGIVNILRSHGLNVVMRRKRWVHSAALIAAMVATMVTGFWSWHNSAAERAARQLRKQILARKLDAARKQWNAQGRKGPEPRAQTCGAFTAAERERVRRAGPGRVSLAVGMVYDPMLMGLDGLFPALSSAMFSLLALYIASAAYRAFRVRSWEAGLMMLTALLVMLGQIPLGGRLLDGVFARAGYGGGIAGVRGWIMKYVNSAAFRGIAFGAFVAMLAMGIRVWLSMETGAFYQEED